MLNLLLMKLFFMEFDQVPKVNTIIFYSFPYDIGIKILSVVVRYLQKGRYNFKYKKINRIYTQIINKNGKLRSQNTIFQNISNKIVISCVK